MKELYSVQGILTGMLNYHQLPAYQLFRLKNEYPDIVGKPFNQFSFILGVEKDVLMIGVENPMVMNELHIRKRVILKKIDNFLQSLTSSPNRLKLNDIRIRSAIKNKPNQPSTHSEQVVQLVSLDEQRKAYIQTQAESLPESIRQTFIDCRIAVEEMHLNAAQYGFTACSRCHDLHDGEDDLCGLCKSQVENERMRQVIKLLKVHPEMSMQAVEEQVIGGHRYYESARFHLINRIRDKMYHRIETDEEKWLIASLIMRKKRDEISIFQRDRRLNYFKRKPE